jgi:hypothetical protein
MQDRSFKGVLAFRTAERLPAQSGISNCCTRSRMSALLGDVALRMG